MEPIFMGSVNESHVRDPGHYEGGWQAPKWHPQNDVNDVIVGLTEHCAVVHKRSTLLLVG